jgi:RNA polymerase sigma-70 factor, ECF subfamily
LANDLGNLTGVDGSDDELMHQFRLGNALALGQIYDRHHRTIYHFARLLLRDDLQAEEVLQETFLALARSVSEYRSEGRFRPWILRICRNCCFRRMEYARYRQTTPLANLNEAELAARGTAGPDASAESREQLEVVQQGIAMLPPRQREAVLLYAVQEMDYRQIAGVMGVPINTVKTLIHRGRSTLAELLAQRNGSGRDELD